MQNRWTRDQWASRLTVNMADLLYSFTSGAVLSKKQIVAGFGGRDSTGIRWRSDLGNPYSNLQYSSREPRTARSLPSQ